MLKKHDDLLCQTYLISQSFHECWKLFKNLQSHLLNKMYKLKLVIFLIDFMADIVFVI